MLRFLPIILIIAFAIVQARLTMRRSARDLDANSVELVDPDLRPALARLAGALDVPRVKVHLLEVAMVNGLAAPDGRVFLTRGFYDRFRSGAVTAEEIASVVAHELGHVALGHASRRGIDFAGQSAVGTGLAFVLARVIPFIGPLIAQTLVGLVGKGLSRRDEVQADAYATALLIKAGIGAGPQKSLFRKPPALAGGADASGVPAWLLTHPKVESRIKAIEANEARWLA